MSGNNIPLKILYSFFKNFFLFKSSCNFKRKNPLLTPTKSFKPIEPTTIPIEPVDLFENFDESLLDLDVNLT